MGTKLSGSVGRQGRKREGVLPAALAELLCELDEKLGDEPPNFDTIRESQLPMLNAVVWEALRLFPPVAADPKCAAADDILPDGTFVPAGAEIAYLPFVMGRDPDAWEDADKFIPHRWIPFKQPSLFELPIFQAGPRVCLGMQMA